MRRIHAAHDIEIVQMLDRIHNSICPVGDYSSSSESTITKLRVAYGSCH